MRVLVVEDDQGLASAIVSLVEENPRYTVVGVANRASDALLWARRTEPHLALVDLRLAGQTTGYATAVRLNEMGIACLLITADPPKFPVSDLTLGCLSKPFTAEDLHRSLQIVEDQIRGRPVKHTRKPDNFTSYE